MPPQTLAMSLSGVLQISMSEVPNVQRERTYNQYPNSKISSVKHPETPTCQPPIAFFEGYWYDRRRDDVFQDGAVVSLFYYPGQGYCQLEVLQVSDAYIDRILEAAAQ